ncbi:RING finger and transmembrane domain-containing protein 2-like [Plakobranchus ocellatus]|uniref:RING finger and transmembrane domain-containing protein 2-like n=1 Tax=Plakobranchus ocellatus TaxID=259542 RepID=A0AAV4DJR3_9GAST|nr:RING finger and transmembrane domain-containing protein 2-like [Plakobranchus ocellatus]
MSSPPSEQGHISSSSAAASPPPSAAASTASQALRWSLQNFPVPLQFQARIPRSPLSVAQELLPNFPAHTTHHHHHRRSSNLQDDEFIDMQRSQSQAEQPINQHQTQHQFQMSLQQHIQQQLQQQFQRQLQLNLQGGDAAQGGPVILPDPPDTVIDLDDETSNNTNSNQQATGGRFSGALSGISSSSSRRLLESLLRGAQAASSSSHPNSNNNSTGGRGRGSGGSGHHTATEETRTVGLGAGNGGVSTPGLSPLSLGHAHHHHHNNSGGSGGGDGDGAVGLNSGATQSGARAGTTGQGLQQPAELSLLYKWAAESGIFILLLLLHFLYDHRLGLLVFLCLGGTFYYSNMKLVHAIHQSAVREHNRSWFGLLNQMWLCGFLVLNIFILYYVFSEQRLWRILYFQMATVSDISVWTLLWCVVMTDYIIKFFTVITKSLLAILQPFCKNYRRRGKYYLLIESISQLYRQVVTVVPWLYYLNDSTRTSVWFAFITEAVYLGFKSWSVWGSVQFLYSSLQRFQSNTSFGTKPSSNDMLERGSQCPICQDTVNEPIMLPCKHIFCEQCVSIWFDREKTCPMCRAEITTESPMWKDGNTSSHLQWH